MNLGHTAAEVACMQMMKGSSPVVYLQQRQVGLAGDLSFLVFCRVRVLQSSHHQQSARAIRVDNRKKARKKKEKKQERYITRVGSGEAE